MKNILYIPFALLTVTLLSSTVTYGQTKALSKGDTLPELNFDKSFNYKRGKPQTINLHELKGKIVIFDFWNPWCIPCVASFPKLDSLQQKYRDQLQIITVTSDNHRYITDYFNKYKNAHRPDIPGVTSDTILHKFFPHTGVPFQVWIGKTGQVLQQTGGYALTEKNLVATFENEQQNIRQAKKNIYVETLVDERWKQDVLYSSNLLRYQFARGLHVDGPVTGKGFSEVGTIVTFYQRIYDELTGFKYELSRPGRLVLEVRDKTQYVNNNIAEDGIKWDEQHLYYYELCVPKSFQGNPFELMKQDFERYFSVRTKIEMWEIQCLTLVRTSNKDKLRSKGGKALNDFKPNSTRGTLADKKRRLINQPFPVLVDAVKAFTEVAFKLPFKVDTGYGGNIDLEFDGEVLDRLDLSKFRKALNKYDLDLVMKPYQMEVLVIKE